MIKFKHKGSFASTEGFFNRIKHRMFMNKVESFAEKGVAALAAATPRDTGKTAESWYYEIEDTGNMVTITWNNSNEVKSANAPYFVNVALILNYGHGTKDGGFIEGLDFINPTLKPIFDELVEQVWGEVIKR